MYIGFRVIEEILAIGAPLGKEPDTSFFLT
jgi:hypothetical protein